jgi:orotate phosphoribosyltransferase
LVGIFNYGFDAADENFKQAKCRFLTLSNYNALINYAAEHSYITPEELKLLRNWREDPQNWGKS